MTPFVIMYRVEGSDRLSAQAVAADNSDNAISGLRSFFEAENMICSIIGALTETDLEGMGSLIDEVKKKLLEQQAQPTSANG